MTREFATGVGAGAAVCALVFVAVLFSQTAGALLALIGALMLASLAGWRLGQAEPDAVLQPETPIALPHQNAGDVALALRELAAEMNDSSDQQARGVTEQAAVVEQTTRTLEALLRAADELATASDDVSGHVVATDQVIAQIGQRVHLLSGQVHRIAEVLAAIRGIANRTDLLAMNAALEGAKAGAAGEGFLEVAERMRRLSESVLRAVGDIRQLTLDIRSATSASVLATEEAQKRSASAASSVEAIRATLERQRSGTRQVTQAMGEISTVVSELLDRGGRFASTAERLEALSSQLQGERV